MLIKPVYVCCEHSTDADKPICVCIYPCRCLSGHASQENLDKHLEYCQAAPAARVVMPEGEDVQLKFTNTKKMLKAPYVIYADTEALIKPCDDERRGNTTRQNVHEVRIASSTV